MLFLQEKTQKNNHTKAINLLATKWLYLYLPCKRLIMFLSMIMLLKSDKFQRMVLMKISKRSPKCGLVYLVSGIIRTSTTDGVSPFFLQKIPLILKILIKSRFRQKKCNFAK